MVGFRICDGNKITRNIYKKPVATRTQNLQLANYKIKISSLIHSSQLISAPAVHQTKAPYYIDNIYRIHFP